MDIVEELRNNRESGARRLEAEYKAGLMALARRFFDNESDAEELVNGTFASVVEHIDEYVEQSAFFGWMCQILMSEISRQTRRKSNRMEVFPGEVPDVADPNAQDAIFRSFDHSLVRSAIEELPESDREVLLMRYFMDIPVVKMAKILCQPVGTVYSRLHYARKALAAKLGAAAKKPAGKALLLALALCGFAALGAAVYGIGGWKAASDVATTPTSSLDGGLETASPSAANAGFAPGAPSPGNAGFAAAAPSAAKEESTTMKSMPLLSAALGAAMASASAAGTTAAWWHFDEADPGAVAAADAVFSDQSPDVAAQPYFLSDATAAKASGDWLPSYARPFQGLCVLDPVSGEMRRNRASMKFATSESGKYGGALVATIQGNSPFAATASAITVEAFVCTTGGVFSTFAPIVACMQYENWTAEKWAIYEETDGTIGLRFDGTVYYRGNSGQAGTAKINDGAWHHVAFTWDGSTVKVFVDYAQDSFASGSPRQFAKSTTLKYNNGGQWDTVRIGGYTGKSGDQTARRRFNGLIDEVRVSAAALTPDQFLRMQPPDMDDDEILRVSFEPGEYGAVSYDANLADALGPGSQTALLKRRNAGGSAAFDASSTPSASIGPALFADAVADSGSIFFATNGTGADSGCYVVAPNLAGRLVGGSATNFTVECFFKTRGQVRGPLSNRQSIFRLGAYQLVEAMLCEETSAGQMSSGNILSVSRNASGTFNYDGTLASDAMDDSAWHHVAFVVDGDRRQVRTYVDGRLSHSRSNYDFGFTYANNNYGLYVGCGFDSSSAWKPIRFFDGWMDSLRVTKRALAPEEFMSATPLGKIADGPQPLLFADFGGNCDLVCASNAAFSVSGRLEAQTGGNVPAFVDSSFGSLLLDGPDGTDKVQSVKDLSFSRGRVVFPASPLFALDAWTLEFWAKFTGIETASGPVAGDTVLPENNNPGILRCTQGDGTAFDWFLYRGYWSGSDLSVAVKTGLGGSSTSYLDFTLGRNVVDGRWHHYALSFEPAADFAKTLVSLYDDYELVETKECPLAYVNRAGRVLKLFEGSADYPNVVGLVNSLRISRGALPPSRFLGREGSSFVMIVR